MSVWDHRQMGPACQPPRVRILLLSKSPPCGPRSLGTLHFFHSRSLAPPLYADMWGPWDRHWSSCRPASVWVACTWGPPVGLILPIRAGHCNDSACCGQGAWDWGPSARSEIKVETLGLPPQIPQAFAAPSSSNQEGEIECVVAAVAKRLHFLLSCPSLEWKTKPLVVPHAALLQLWSTEARQQPAVLLPPLG